MKLIKVKEIKLVLLFYLESFWPLFCYFLWHSKHTGAEISQICWHLSFDNKVFTFNFPNSYFCFYYQLRSHLKEASAKVESWSFYLGNPHKETEKVTERQLKRIPPTQNSIWSLFYVKHGKGPSKKMNRSDHVDHQ